MSELLKFLRNAGVIILSLFTAFGMGFIAASDIFSAVVSKLSRREGKFDTATTQRRGDRDGLSYFFKSKGA